ncbi:MAG TPA: Rieske 2Fe-2S domain-containing protein [Patescibacteria group bacterium]|nr:Rieske 2Fe-2S domain-containing protein [Patescibacteria group bacterium]
MSGQPLCRLDDLDDPGSAGFVLRRGGQQVPLLVVRVGGRVNGYVNSCPHIGAPLDWTSGQFLSRDKSHILCAVHGALFRLHDGLCVGGPCAGKALIGYPLVLKDGVVLAAE